MAANEFVFQPAQTMALKMQLAIEGASGSGKTLTALLIAQWLAEKENCKIGLIDTEHRSSAIYAKRFIFDVLNLVAPYTSDRYIQTLVAAERAGFGVVIIDSLSHEWSGSGGCLERAEQFQSWRNVRPEHNRLVETMMWSPFHLIATMRAKEKHAMVTKPDGGTKVQKLGLGAIQDRDIGYEFQTVLTMDMQHVGAVTKYRYDALAEHSWPKPGADLAQIYYDLLINGDTSQLVLQTKSLWAAIARELGVVKGEKVLPAEGAAMKSILGDTYDALAEADAERIRSLGVEGGNKLRAWAEEQDK